MNNFSSFDFWTIFNINNEPLKVSGHIGLDGNYIQLHFPIISAGIFQIIHSGFIPPLNLSVFDSNGYCFSVLHCRFTNPSISLGAAGVATYTGTFHRLVCEKEFGQHYDVVDFTFIGIEKLFLLEKFNTIFEDDEHKLSFVKESSHATKHLLPNDVEISIYSAFPGAIESDNLVSLHVEQVKRIKLSFPQAESVDFLLAVVSKVKMYVEFILKQEISIKDIKFGDVPLEFFPEGFLLADPIFLPKSAIKTIGENCFHQSLNEFISGLVNWFEKYEEFEKVINLWMKTIYSPTAGLNDLFLWRCQSFELYCQLNNEIYECAKQYVSKGQQYPNLANFLTAIPECMDVDFRGPKDIFTNIKNSRDYFTHNNPTKKSKYNLTDQIIVESFAYMEDFAFKTLLFAIGIDGVRTWPQRFNPFNPYLQFKHECDFGLVEYSTF